MSALPLTSRPPYVSVQHESVMFGCAPAEHDRMGSATSAMLVSCVKDLGRGFFSSHTQLAGMVRRALAVQTPAVNVRGGLPSSEGGEEERGYHGARHLSFTTWHGR